MIFPDNLLIKNPVKAALAATAVKPAFASPTASNAPAPVSPMTTVTAMKFVGRCGIKTVPTRVLTYATRVRLNLGKMARVALPVANATAVSVPVSVSGMVPYVTLQRIATSVRAWDFVRSIAAPMMIAIAMSPVHLGQCKSPAPPTMPGPRFVCSKKATVI